MTRASERVLQEAELSPEAPRYHVLSTLAALTLMVVGIPFIPIVVPLVYWYYQRYYQNLRVVLTNRDLKVHRGILTREEKSIPLEKITDLRVFQGPIMRRMGLKGLAVETAGQTSDQSALVSVVGIEDTDDFRDAALNQRDRVSDAPEEEPSPALPKGDGVDPDTTAATVAVLEEIRDTLKRMEERMGQERRTGAPE